DAEAEAILARLEAYSAKAERHRDGPRLLAGLLVTPHGKRWEAAGDYYRLGSRAKPVRAVVLEQAIVARVWGDLQAPAFTQAIVRTAREQAAANATDGVAEQRAMVQHLDGKIARLVELTAETTTPAPLLRQVEHAEQQRQALLAEIAE